MQPHRNLECKQLPQEKVILAGMPASSPLPLPVPPGCLRQKVSGQPLVTADGGASPWLPASHRGARHSTSEALKAGDHRDSGLCYQIVYMTVVFEQSITNTTGRCLNPAK